MRINRLVVQWPGQWSLNKELIGENVNNGGDDNVETLTGNDVGTSEYLAARE
jgi:hypothetical protein